MPTRGVLYIHWGRDRFPEIGPALKRSKESLARFHRGWPVHEIELPPEAGLVEKARMYEMSPFDETLYLDVDTEVLGNLEFGFEKALKFGLACCICEAPYACRFEKSAIKGDVIEYNTGVMFFTKRPEVERLFVEWARLAPGMDSSLRWMSDRGVQTQAQNDQPSFAKAVHDLDYHPFVLPPNWNFRPDFQKSFFGPIKIWHSFKPMPDELRFFNNSNRPPNVMRFGRIGG